MTGEKLYDRLNAIFGSAVSDRLDEREQAIKVLDRALADGIDPEHIISKMNAMNRIADGSKGKLSHAIVGKFWERQFVKQVEYRPFNIDDWNND